MIMILLGNINAIPFRRRFGGGGGTPFPNIPGMIARWSAKGLTNEDMSTNPVWKDLTGNGHDLQMKNFGWAGMSGVNGYVENFNDFRTGGIPVEHLIVDEQNSSLIKISVLVPGINNSIYIPKDRYQFGKSYYLRVSSEGYNEGDLSFLLYATAVSTATSIRIPLNPNGITEIPAVQEDDYQAAYITVGGKMGSLTIEQLPLYPGFILGDGVNDFAVAEKELNFEDTYTVYTAFIPFQDDPARNMILCGKNETKDFSINYSGTHINFQPSTGVNLAPRINQFMLLVCKRNKDITTIINLFTGESRSLSSKEFIANPGLYYLWRNVFATFLARAAIAGQTICNGYFSTDEDDEKVLNYYKQEYPWLFPDQAWTVVGKTNEDTDRATIANITVNGNNLVLSNFGFAEGSGYNEEGEYAGYLVTDGVDDKIQSSAFTVGKDWTTVGEWEFLKEDAIKIAGIAKFGSFRFYNYSLTGRMNVYINAELGTNVVGNSIKAVTSKGSVYLDFNSLQKVTPGDAVDFGQMLMIGHNGTNYTKIAFKNLAIFPKVLSKEDCIKAYIYLQTLKAKQFRNKIIRENNHEGTEDDPIPYTPPMELFNGKFYTQDGVKYKCTRDSGTPLSHDLKDLVGTYVETV